jgi:NAD(P)-dependent dehydrogenase (short-subunit alcohol dehydrogenase family)
MTQARFEGRSVLVTGGGSGIGFATAAAFATEGARVTISDLDEKRGRKAVADIEALGGTAQFIAGDATRESDVELLVARAVEAFGPLRHAFNNVGLSREGTIETMTREDWDWTLATTLTSTWLAMKHEIPMLLANGGGTIVNTASMSGKIFTSAASPAYSAAKAGVIHLSQYASATYAAQGVRVNSVSPGLTATPLIVSMFSEGERNAIAAECQTIARAVDPNEVAATVLFLSSDDAAMITGTDTEVSGGRR